MKRRCLVGVIFFAWIPVLAAWLLVPRSACAEDLIRARGCNAVAGLCDDWGKAFAAANPGVTVHVAGGETESGFEGLMEKRADIVLASRKILEKELQAAALSEVSVEEVRICNDAVAVITSPQNPIESLTLEQAGKIFTGDIGRWNDVGGPNAAIEVIIPSLISGVSLFVRERLMDNDYFSSDAKIKDHYQRILSELSRKSAPGIGFALLRDAKRGEKSQLVKTVALKVDDKSAAVLPTAATIANGSYPLILPVYFYYDSKKASPLVRKFVDFAKKQCEARQ